MSLRWHVGIVVAALAACRMVGVAAAADESEEQPIRAVLADEDLAIEESPAALRWKFRSGEKLRYRIEEESFTPLVNGSGQPSSIGMELTWSVYDVGDTGVADIRLRIDRIWRRMHLDTPTDNDTARPAAEQPADFRKGTAPLLEAVFRFRISPRGKPSAFAEPPALAKSPGLMTGSDPNATIEMLKHLVSQMSPTLPQAEASAGTRWNHAFESRVGRNVTKEVTMDLTYRGGTLREAALLQVVDFDPHIVLTTLRGPGSRIKKTTDQGTGRMLFDNEAGRLVEMELVEHSDVAMTANNETETIRMTYRYTARLLGDE